MNVENIRKTIEAIRVSNSYSQDRFVHCGTPACIAGHAVVACGWKLHPSLEIITRDNVPPWEFHGIEQTAKEELGLTDLQATELFAGSPLFDREPSKQDAIDTLEHFLETREVEWIPELRCNFGENK